MTAQPIDFTALARELLVGNDTRVLHGNSAHDIALLTARVERLVAPLLARARQEGIEEAAKAVESCNCFICGKGPTFFAKQIRALSPTPPISDHSEQGGE